MHPYQPRSVSGHVYRVERKRGAVWYVKYRLPDGRQVKKLLGPEWTGKGRPDPGWFRQREAEAALQAILTDARRGLVTAPKPVTFGEAAEEWMRHGEHERALKRSTLKDYRSALGHLLPAFGHMRLEAITTQGIERWRREWLRKTGRPRQAAKLVAIMHGIYVRARRAYGIHYNPAAEVEKLKLAYDRSDYDFYSVEEVWALVRAAADATDAALYLTAAFTGLRRGEVVALRWRDVDFELHAIRVMGNFIHGEVVTPKSGKGRTVPMVPDVAHALARLSQREWFVGPDDLVFPGTCGRHMDASALRRRYIRAQGHAGLRRLRFHDLRHTFGSLAIDKASIVQVQHWLGHADVDTTSRYLHHKSRADEAALLARAFAPRDTRTPIGGRDEHPTGGPGTPPGVGAPSRLPR